MIRPALGSLVNREASAGRCSAGDDSQIYFIHFIHVKRKKQEKELRREKLLIIPVYLSLSLTFCCIRLVVKQVSKT